MLQIIINHQAEIHTETEVTHIEVEIVKEDKVTEVKVTEVGMKVVEMITEDKGEITVKETTEEEITVKKGGSTEIAGSKDRRGITTDNLNNSHHKYKHKHNQIQQNKLMIIDVFVHK